MQMPVTRIKASGLRCHTLAPVDLHVAAGECLALVGPSGAGKSLVLRMLADLIPHEGECWLDGVAMSSIPASRWRRSVRYVAAEAAWWAPAVADHFDKPGQQAERLKALGLSSELMNMAPDRLSTGERQRMAFLRAVEDEPQVLLLDEPTAALDADSVRMMEELIRELMLGGCAVIIVSHDQAQVDRLAKAVIRLEKQL